MIAGSGRGIFAETITQFAHILGDFRLLKQFAVLPQAAFNRHANIARLIAAEYAFFGIAEIGQFNISGMNAVRSQSSQ